MLTVLPKMISVSLFMLIINGFQNAAAQQDVLSQDPLVEALQTNQRSIRLDKHSRFIGNGYDWLIEKGSESQFFMIGEEHGIAENPLLSAQLFESLQKRGYQHLAIEVSPPMASHINDVLRNGGLDGLKASYSFGTEPAFFGMAEEAILLAKVQKISDAVQPFWGLDYEVSGDKVLIQKLNSMNPSGQAKRGVEALEQASNRAWQQYQDTQNPQYVFSFSGDVTLVDTIRKNWLSPPAPAREILQNLKETLVINKLWIEGKGYRSNVRRAQLFRDNFLNYWREQPQSKIMLKLGASHLMRGLNSNNTYDLGSLVPEIAALNQTKSFSVLVLPGQNSQVAVLDPTVWQYRSALAKDGYSNDLELFYSQAAEEGFTLYDLTSLRSTVFKREYAEHLAIREVVSRFDALLIMTGSTAASSFIPHRTL